MVQKEVNIFHEKSEHYNPDEDCYQGDIVKIVIRGVETMKVLNLDEFKSFPFEVLNFTLVTQL